MPRAAAGKPAAKRGPKASKLATQFPSGTVLTDLCKKAWQLGDVIGQGGFGLIYLASSNQSPPAQKDSAENVIKIEPKGNGPLYCEMYFYQRAAKENDVAEFAKRRKLQYLSIPPFIATGVHTYQSQEYRFLVMPRFGSDLQRLLVDQGGTLSPSTVFGVGLRMVDALEYMHEKKYVHADVKAANILLGYKNNKVVSNQVYLVDFGLATLYTTDSKHKEYKEDPRRAHDGTIEFTSRDAHRGVAPSRRGDFEILGYCLLQWLCGKLPWETNLKDPNAVAANKEKYMQNLPSLMAACFSKASPEATVHTSTVQKFLEEVNNLKYDTEPNYNQLRTILKAGLTKTGHKNEWQVDFTAAPTKSTSKRKSAGGDAGSSTPVKKAKMKAGSPQKKPAARASKSPSAGKGKATAGSAKRSKTSAASPRKAVSSPRKAVASPRKAVLTSSPASSPSPRKSPKAQSVRNAGSPLAAAKSPKASGGRKAAVPNGRSPPAAKPKKHFPMPAPTKPRVKSPLVPAKPSSSNPTRRRVKRVTAVQSDAAIQTSPLRR